MKRAGFTLIELLVVLAIIIILAGILLPVVISARRKFGQSVCSSNLRQLSMAISMYTQDHDGYPPIGAYDYTPEPPAPQNMVRVDWEDELISAAYVKNYKIFNCPQDNNRDYRAAYGVNRWMMGWGFSPLFDSPPYPSNTVLISEKVDADWLIWPPSEHLNQYYRPLDPRHENQLNILYADGHVGSRIVDQLIEGPGSNVIWRY